MKVYTLNEHDSEGYDLTFGVYSTLEKAIRIVLKVIENYGEKVVNTEIDTTEKIWRYDSETSTFIIEEWEVDEG